MDSTTVIQIVVFGLAALIVFLFLFSGLHFVKAVISHNAMAERERTIASFTTHMAEILRGHGNMPMVELRQKEGVMIVQPDGDQNLALRLDSEDERVLKALALKIKLDRTAKETAKTSAETASSSDHTTRPAQIELQGMSDSPGPQEGEASSSQAVLYENQTVIAEKDTIGGQERDGSSGLPESPEQPENLGQPRISEQLTIEAGLNPVALAPESITAQAAALPRTSNENSIGLEHASQGPDLATRHRRNISLTTLELQDPTPPSRVRRTGQAFWIWLKSPDSRFN